MAPLELTTRFSAITTGAGSSRALTACGAAKTGAAHLRYIDRSAAVGHRVGRGFPPEVRSRAQVLAHLRERMRAQAAKGGRNGSRVAEKIIVSLPVEWPPEAQRLALSCLASRFAPPGSEALAYGVLHTDKPQNPHLHLLVIDGRESAAAARQRRPDAQRVRQRNVIRLGDRGRPGELRAEIGATLNAIARQHGLRGVETRSFRARGIATEPTRHEGQARRAASVRSGAPCPVAQKNAARRRWRRVAYSAPQAAAAVREVSAVACAVLDEAGEETQAERAPRQRSPRVR